MSFSALLEHQSHSHPDLVLYYKPLGERQQILYRRQFPMYGDPMKFLTMILIEQGVFIEDTSSDTTALLEDETLPELAAEFIVEGGAAILGWKRKKQETREDFSTRIERELHQAYENEEGGAP